MTVDPTVLPGLLLLALELLVLAVVGVVVARVALRQSNDLLALAQGMVIGLALWGLAANFVLRLLPGLAGALATWVVVLALAAVLAWRSPAVLRLPLRTAGGLAAAALLIFWVALAARQLLKVPDYQIHFGLSSLIRAGNWPPITPWNPWLPVPYHYGVDVAIGLLAPPFGPDIAFTSELLGAYAWTGLMLIIGTYLLRYGGWISVFTLAPLALTAGAWTLILVGDAPTILQVPVPLDLPTAGFRTSFANVYWPTVELPWSEPEPAASPPNIWKPPFPLAYALVLVVLERAATGPRPSRWTVNATLAVLFGFIGLIEETVALVGLTLWAGLEAARFLPRPADRARSQANRNRTAVASRRSAGASALVPPFVAGEPLTRRTLVRAAVGPMLAALLLAIGGGAITGALGGNLGGGLSIGWINDPERRHLLGLLTDWPGGLKVLGLGPIAVAVAAALLGTGHRLVLALAIGSAFFVIAALTLQYDGSNDLVRLDGHARNLALLALLVALAVRLRAARGNWRYTVAVSIVALVVWPTIAQPVHALGIALQRGVHLSNAQPAPPEFDPQYRWMGRSTLTPFASEGVRAYIRDHTAIDARIFTPDPTPMSIDTGRPNASGLVGRIHLFPFVGPEYQDVLQYLEPAAVRRLGFRYVHATNVWVDSLPDLAQRRLDDPRLFELLVRDGAHALYRVLPAFLNLTAAPASGSFEALRQAVPAGATAYLSPAIEPISALRAAVTLSHVKLLGHVSPEVWHLLTEVPVEPLNGRMPDLVATTTRLAPTAFPPELRFPVWWNRDIAVYATSDGLAPAPEPSARLFTAQLRDARESAGRLAFTATLTATSGEGWTGQDWLVVPADDSPWALSRIRLTDPAAQWYAGQASPRSGAITHRYEFDPQAVTLSLRDEQLDATHLDSSGKKLESGVWILAVRLRSAYQLTAFIPVVKIVVTEAGDVSYEVYEGPLDAMLAS